MPEASTRVVPSMINLHHTELSNARSVDPILAPWGTTVAGLLPPWLMALGPATVAHDGMSLPPWVTALCPSHATGPLLAAPTVVPHSGMPVAVGHGGRCIDLQNF
jgi:hypothetical protein